MPQAAALLWNLSKPAAPDWPDKADGSSTFCLKLSRVQGLGSLCKRRLPNRVQVPKS